MGVITKAKVQGARDPGRSRLSPGPHHELVSPTVYSVV